MQLLIITNSYDATTDILLDRLDNPSVFRLNFDLIGQYKIRIDTEGFEIADPNGRTINLRTIGKAYWRKPFQGGTEEKRVYAKYVDSEMRYVLAELVNFLWASQKLILVEPFSERRVGKLLQLHCAQTRFAVPNYDFVLNETPGVYSGVVKSLTSELVGDKVLYTTRVEADDLDLRYPWFVQQYIAATHDVTVVFVRGRMFAFSLERDFLKSSIDWREHISPDQNWITHSLPDKMSRAIREYMKALKLHYGRLDFLLDDTGKYWFCEVNPNGQFAWLDLNGEEGLLDSVVEEISPLTEHHPIPNPHPLEGSMTQHDASRLPCLTRLSRVGYRSVSLFLLQFVTFVIRCTTRSDS